MANFAQIKASKLASLLSESSRHGDFYVGISGDASLVLSSSPFEPKFQIDFSTEMIRPFSVDIKGSVKRLSSTPIFDKGVRRSGNYWFEIQGERTECISLKELLNKALRELEARSSGTLEKLSQIKPRTRRIVARDPKALFDRQHLAKDHSQQLMGGWWVGTNNSADETKTWLKRACLCANLKWGREFKTSL